MITASLIIRRILDRTLQKIKLVDPEAGRVDDIQIFTENRLDAYQVKWSRVEGTFTYNDLIKPKDDKQSLIQQLTNGWMNLRRPGIRTVVHLYTNDIPSRYDHVSNAKGECPPSPNSFAHFLDKIWFTAKANPEHFSKNIPQGWEQIWKEFKASTGLSDEEFIQFVQDCELDFKQTFLDSDTLETEFYRLYHFLYDEIAKSRTGEPLEYTREELIIKLGWQDRFELRSKHNFTILEPYLPLGDKINEFFNAISSNSGGYITILGPPGIGKSSFLAYIPSKENMRIIKYFIHLQGSREPVAFRAEAENFLHDLILRLENWGIKISARISQNLTNLCQDFLLILEKLSEEWRQNGVKTVFIIDGVDHIGREQPLSHSLTRVLMPPNQVPEGVYFVLGTQTLNSLPARIKNSLMNPNRQIKLSNLSKDAVFNIIERFEASIPLTSEYKSRIFEKSNGHPLALRYILNFISQANNLDEIDLFLQKTIQYYGDIEEIYSIHWELIRSDRELIHFFGLITRLRGYINKNWLLKTFGIEKVEILKKFLHYFQYDRQNRLYFFHPSFREFLLKKTMEFQQGQSDFEINQRYHQELAELISESHISEKDPISWEVLYHFYHAKQHAKVLEIATQEYFRQQFLNFRPTEDIQRDISIAIRSAGELGNITALIRYILIGAEIYQRDGQLSNFRTEFFRILLFSGKIDELLDYSREGYNLRISKKDALEVSRFLVEFSFMFRDTGKSITREEIFDQARTLFKLAEPIKLFSGDKEEYHLQDLDVLTNWAKAASFFLEPSDILEKLKNVENIPIRGEKDPNSSRNFRNNLLFLVIRTILDQEISPDSQAKIEALEESLNLREKEDLFVHCWIQFIKCRKYLEINELDEADNIIEVIESNTCNLISDLPLSLRIHLAKIILERSGAVKAKEWVKDLSPPVELTNFIFKPYEKSKHIFIEQISFLSIKIALEELNPTEIEHTEPNERKEPASHFRHATLVVADIWGHALVGSYYDQSELLKFMNEILDSLKNFQESDPHSGAFTNTPWVELLKSLISIIFEFYPEMNNSLKDILLQELDDSPKGIYWPLNYQRDLLLILNRYASSNQDIKDRLLKMESKISAEINSYDRLEQLCKHALAFTHLNDKYAAIRYLDLILRESFGIFWRKDFQLDSFIRILSSFISNKPELAAEKIGLFAPIIPVLGKITEWRVEESAAIELLQTSFGWSPANTVQLFHWFLEQESLRYFSGLNSILVSALDINNFNLNIAKLCMEYYLIPLSQEVPSRFLNKLFSAIKEKLGSEQVKEYARTLVLKIKYFALPSIRNEWYIEIAKNVARLGLSPLYLELTGVQIKPQSAYNLLELKDGRMLNLIDILENVCSFSDFLDLWSKKKEPSNFSWSILIHRLSPFLSLREIEQLIEIFSEEKRILHILALILISRENLEKAEEICRKIIQMSDPLDWNPWEGQLLLETLKTLTQINPSSMDEEIKPFIVDKLTERPYNLYSTIYFLSELVSLFENNQDKELIESFWKEIEEYLHNILYHIRVKREFTWNNANKNKDSPNRAILSLIVENLESDIDALKEMSQKISLDLLIQRNEQIRALIIENLRTPTKPYYGTLVVLHAACLQTPDILSDFSETLFELHTHPNIKNREIIISIFESLQKSPPKVAKKRLNSFDELLTRPDPTSRASSEIGRVIQYFFGDFLLDISLRSRVSPIYLQSCLNQLISRENPMIFFDEDYVKRFNHHNRNVGLQFSGRKLQFLAVRHAIFQLVALMIDGFYLEPSSRYLSDFYYFYDPYLCVIEPSEKPEYILPVHREDFINEESFFNKINELPEIYWVEASNNQVNLAELTEYQILTRPIGSEHRKCFIFKEIGVNAPNDFYMVHNIRMSEYDKIDSKIDDSNLIIQNSVLFNETRCTNWIAFNPKIAKELEWKLSKDGLFRWIDVTGKTMVESIWWVDGLIDHRSLHFCDVGEGWVVVASTNAFEQIKTLGKLKQKSIIKRTLFGENIEEKESTYEKSIR